MGREGVSAPGIAWALGRDGGAGWLQISPHRKTGSTLTQGCWEEFQPDLTADLRNTTT